MLQDLLVASGNSKPLPLSSWRSGEVGTVPKVNNLPATIPSNFNSYGCRPLFIKKHNGALYLLACYINGTTIYRGIFKSIDNGLNWIVKNNNLLTDSIDICDFFITSTGRFIITRYATYGCYSDDEGITWNNVKINVFSASGTAIFKIAENNGILIITGRAISSNVQQYVAISTNNGSSWSAKQIMTTGGMTNNYPAYGNGMWLVNDTGTIYRSLDNGVTWSKLTTTGITIIGNMFKFLNNKFFIYNTVGSEFNYSSNGITWLSKTMPSGMSGINTIDYDSETDSYVITGKCATKEEQYIGIMPSDFSTITKYSYPSEIQNDANKNDLKLSICANGKIIILTDPSSKCFISP